MRKLWVVTLRGASTSLPCMASKSMTATMASYPLAPTWALNPFAADDSSRKKDSWNLLRNALTFMLKTGRTKRVA
jgi:hypothetical protein